MFSRNRAEEVISQIKDVVAELFEYLEDNVKIESDYIVFLANGHKTEYVPDGISPFVIGPGIEFHNDKDRVEFYLQYFQSGSKERYEVLEEDGEIEDIAKHRKFTLYLELMIYNHIWENKKNIRDLKQISQLIEQNEYDWNLEIDDYGKSKIVRNKIRDVLLRHNLKAGEIIKEAYHNQIRNAFAHSQISFMPNGKRISFGNYDGKYHDLQHLSEKDWEERFLKSIVFFTNFN